MNFFYLFPNHYDEEYHKDILMSLAVQRTHLCFGKHLKINSKKCVGGMRRAHNLKSLK